MAHYVESFALQYKVKDIAEADFGRMEIDLAEAEMPGLMSCRAGKLRAFPIQPLVYGVPERAVPYAHHEDPKC